MFDDKNNNGIPDGADRLLNAWRTRVSSIKKASDARKNKAPDKRTLMDDLSFTVHAWRHWYIYGLLLFSAFFSGMLGVFIGLAPTMDNGVITISDAPINTILAVGYGLAFIVVTEIMMAIGEWLFFTRENDNLYQFWTSLIIMIVSGVSILVTGVAGGMVIAATQQFLPSFSVIPEWAQGWVIKVIPALFVIYTCCLITYAVNSRKAVALRDLRSMKSTAETDAEYERHEMDLAAEWTFAQAELKAFLEKVLDGTMTASEASAARKAGAKLTQMSAPPQVQRPNGQQGPQRPMQAYTQDTSYAMDGQETAKSLGVTYEQMKILVTSGALHQDTLSFLMQKRMPLRIFIGTNKASQELRDACAEMGIQPLQPAQVRPTMPGNNGHSPNG